MRLTTMPGKFSPVSLSDAEFIFVNADGSGCTTSTAVYGAVPWIPCSVGRLTTYSADVATRQRARPRTNAGHRHRLGILRSPLELVGECDVASIYDKVVHDADEM